MKQRIYRIQKSGDSFYVCLPKTIVSKQMLVNGVTITPIEVTEEFAILRFKAEEIEYARPRREQHKTDRKSGENAQESRVANIVHEAG